MDSWDCCAHTKIISLPIYTVAKKQELGLLLFSLYKGTRGKLAKPNIHASHLLTVTSFPLSLITLAGKGESW